MVPGIRQAQSNWCKTNIKPVKALQAFLGFRATSCIQAITKGK
jgi:hypothetical protein